MIGSEHACRAESLLDIRRSSSSSRITSLMARAAVLPVEHLHRCGVLGVDVQLSHLHRRSVAPRCRDGNPPPPQKTPSIRVLSTQSSRSDK